VPRKNLLFPLAIIQKLVYAYIILGDRHQILNSVIRNGHSQFQKEREVMKKFTFVLSVLVLASLILTACAPKGTSTPGGGSAEAGLPDLGGKTITVAVENQYPPFNSIDTATNVGVGWDYDAVREICKRINCVPEFKQAAWDGIFPAMASGEYDMLADGVTQRWGRNWAVDFSIPYTTVAQQLVVRADDNHSLAEFVSDANLKVGTQIGTTNFLAAEKYFPDKQILSYSEFPAAVLALLAGDIDAVVLDDTAAYGKSREIEVSGRYRDRRLAGLRFSTRKRYSRSGQRGTACHAC
jgi:polar amino acid transport system substrate-binding protein